MLQLIEHIIRISSKRDRTEINAALVDAMQDLFSPSAFAVYRCYPAQKKSIVFSCAGLGPAGQFSHNAYLPERRHCQPIDHDPLLQRCQTERAIVLETLPNGSDRLVFPVIENNQPVYLIDISLPVDFPADRRVLLMGLVEYFGHHISLLDYGEADTLTGLANRKTFDKHLFEVLGKAADDDARQHPAAPCRRRSGGNEHHWLAICDIDHFKQFNDTYGHDVGDRVLRFVSSVLLENCGRRGAVSRHGGEEFVIIFEETAPEMAFEIIDAARRDLGERHFVNKDTNEAIGTVSFSAGVAVLGVTGDVGHLLRNADRSLYRAKASGRNCVVLADHS